MVKITNGTNVFEVTRGAFDGIYSRQGYTIINEKKDKTDVNVPDTPKKTNDEIFVDEVVEKPISQWSKEEIKRFAALKGIDISGTKSANEAKEIIKSYIEANSQE